MKFRIKEIVSRMSEETTTNFTLNFSKNILFSQIISAIVGFSFIYFPHKLPDLEEIPVILTISQFLGFVVLLDIVWEFYKVLYIKAGIVFNNEGISSRDFPNIEWNEVNDIGINIDNELFVKLKSMKEYVKDHSFPRRILFHLLTFINSESIKEGIEIDLVKYDIGNKELFEKRLRLMKEKYVEQSVTEERKSNKVLNREKKKITLYRKRRKSIIRVISSAFILIVLGSPFLGAFKLVIKNPETILIIFLIVGFVVVANFILGLYRIIFPEVGVVFTEKGIKIDDELGINVAWEEVADMEIGRKKILYVKMKSIHDFWKKRSLVSWRLMSLLERITKEPIEDEIEIDLKRYIIKDIELLDQEFKLMKEEYIEVVST